jgi:two-component system CitB family sensor kinase
MVSLLELGRTQEALDFATKDLELSQQLTDDMVSSVDEPVLGALVMGKVAEAHERGVQLDVAALGVRRAWQGSPCRTWSPSLVTCWTTPWMLPRKVRRPGGWSSPWNRMRKAWISPCTIPVPALILLPLKTFSGMGSAPNRQVPGGRGIGLALVRQAVHRLQGTLTINGRRGAKFEVFLPAAVPAEKEHKQ